MARDVGTTWARETGARIFNVTSVERVSVLKEETRRVEMKRGI